MTPTRIAFVCLGNICRSPTAEGVARHRIAERDLRRIEVESSGTGGWHVGTPPDTRATRAAARRGIKLEGAARQFDVTDLGRLDLVVAMDRSNRDDLLLLAGRQRTTPAPDLAEADGHPPIRLLREWDPDAGDDLDVPDPYYGGPDGFEEVLDIVSRSVDALLDDLVRARR